MASKKKRLPLGETQDGYFVIQTENMSYCCVPFCKSNWKKCRGSFSFQEFPSDRLRCEEWLKVISRDNFIPNSNLPSSVVRSLHFKEEDYSQSGKCRRLIKNAIPSIFPHYPSYKVTSIKRPRRIIEKSYLISPKRRKIVHADNPEPTCTSLSNDNDRFNVSASQTDSLNIEEMTNIINRLRVKVTRLNSSLQEKESEILNYKGEVQEFESDAFHKTLENIKKDATEGSTRGKFLLEQPLNYQKGRPNWHADIIRECVIFQYISPRGYEHVRRRGFLKLPSKRTLERYCGGVDSSTGVMPLIKERLLLEANNLTSVQRFCSLIIDEAAISPKIIYDRKLDSFIHGTHSTGTGRF